MQVLIDQMDKISIVIALIFTSIFFRIVLQVVGQKWIMTTAHTATLVLLPILTFVITSVISGNIALSLGMVGALSIVRFRNPVRSPLELSVYFGAVTLGISASVSLLWLVFLVGSTITATIVLVTINKCSILLLKRPFFTASFSEGNALSTLEIKSNKPIPLVEASEELTVKKSSDGILFYVLASTNFQRMSEIEKVISSDESILEYQLSKS